MNTKMIAVPVDVHDSLYSHAKQNGMTMTGLVTRIIKQWMACDKNLSSKLDKAIFQNSHN